MAQAPRSAWRLARGAVLAASALLLLLCLPFIMSGARTDSLSCGVGEALIEGARPDIVSYHLPMSTVLEDLLLYHAPRWAYKPALALLGAMGGAFLTALAALLAGTAGAAAVLALFAAALAAALARGDVPVEVVGWNVQLLYSLLFVLVAGLLVWRAQKPTRGRALALALALGASLLCRSPLAFFPPLLAAGDFLGARGRRGRWILLVVPYLFLIPWARMNWLVHGEFTPFERREADCNVVTGALGLVPTIEGDWRTLLDQPPNAEKPGAVLGWAARRFLAHPLSAARAYGERLAYVFSFAPALALFAAFSLWRGRRRADFRALFLLSAYFIAVHCFMSVEEKYFIPLWLVWAVLAVTLAAPLGGKKNEAKGPAGAALLAGLAAALLACVVVWRSVLSYAARLARGAHAGEAESAWTLAERARAELSAGAVDVARRDFARALLRGGENPLWQLEHAWTLALEGRDRPLLRYEPVAARYDGLAVRAHLMKAIVFARCDAASARAELAQARACALYENVTVRRVRTPLERWALARLRAGGEEELKKTFAELSRQAGGLDERLALRSLDHDRARELVVPSLFPGVEGDPEVAKAQGEGRDIARQVAN